MYGLADCNNFFVSCERLFRPDLNGKAVVVLSNNDGCAISRSNEAKAMGIKMGQPLYQFRRLVDSGEVTVFSSNYVLYGDLSTRVHNTIAELVPNIEIYSIDEAFLDLRGIGGDKLASIGKDISYRCRKNVGIPVSVGISHTKTLAKIASRLCKQYPKLNGSCVMERKCDIEKVLKSYPVSDVWGIGRRLTARLARRNIITAYDYYNTPREWIHANLGLPGLRTWLELHSEPAIEFGNSGEGRQQICVSRSFAKEMSDPEDIFRQLALFTSMAAEKLRHQDSVASQIQIYLRTNLFKEYQEQHILNRMQILEPATDNTMDMINAVRHLFASSYGTAHPIKKAGIILSGISPRSGRQLSLFDTRDTDKSDRLMSAIDAINAAHGRGSVAIAAQDLNGIRMNRSHLSPQYTTKWSDIITIKI